MHIVKDTIIMIMCKTEEIFINYIIAALHVDECLKKNCPNAIKQFTEYIPHKRHVERY